VKKIEDNSARSHSKSRSYHHHPRLLKRGMLASEQRWPHMLSVDLSSLKRVTANQEGKVHSLLQLLQLLISGLAQHLCRFCTSVMVQLLPARSIVLGTEAGSLEEELAERPAEGFCIVLSIAAADGKQVGQLAMAFHDILKRARHHHILHQLAMLSVSSSRASCLHC